jgi:hypothetical protein
VKSSISISKVIKSASQTPLPVAIPASQPASASQTPQDASSSNHPIAPSDHTHQPKPTKSHKFDLTAWAKSATPTNDKSRIVHARSSYEASQTGPVALQDEVVEVAPIVATPSQQQDPAVGCNLFEFNMAPIKPKDRPGVKSNFN